MGTIFLEFLENGINKLFVRLAMAKIKFRL